MVNPVTVVSSRFLASNSLDLTIVRTFSLSKGNFTVTNANGRVMFKVKRKLFSLSHRLVLLDNAGAPILSFRKQLWSQWDVFKGNSKVSIFSTKQSSLNPFDKSFVVYLGRNSTTNVCDFIVKDSCFDTSSIVYARDGTTIVAKVHKKLSVESVLLGKDRYSVQVHPNIDHAFIIALVVILDQMNQN